MAALLKDCPKGMELDCTTYNNVEFDYVLEGNAYPIKIETPDGQVLLNKYGCYSNNEHAKCVIFPKGKTTWEGFVPPYKYPKTYEECCNILKATHVEWFGYYGEVLVPFQKLIICRDVYWKIAGEQMGLGKPWEPDWAYNCIKYIITVAENEVYTDVSYIFNYILVFPTEEMRDAFYENFKDLIEQCKELL